MICADEFAMPDEAFALSPISARAAQPSEEDYEAISQAFMETSRGRWFLGEYARRNRNADTSMVLDAVARIEESLAAQRQQASDGGLAEALAAIRTAVEDARASAAASLDGLALDATVAPVRKGARVIREISWRLREIGSDGRICDLIDSQLTAIEAGCEQLLSTDLQMALSAAFDLIAERIAGFGEDDSSPTPEAAAPETREDASTETNVAIDVTAEAMAADAHDEAVLDLIALEMGAPDVSEPDSDEIQAAALAAANSERAAKETEKEIQRATLPAPPAQATRPPLRPLQPSPEPSLGSSLLASGIVQRPNSSAADPLAPIRRMSQAEKIAFFS
jgi:hypothetical protein